MATRILLANMDDFVETTLLKLRQGLEDTQDEGLILELPKTVDFQLEVVRTVQSLNQMTTTANTGLDQDSGKTINRTETSTGTTTGTNTGTDTETSTGTTTGTTTGTDTETSTGTGTTTRTATQAQNESGSDTTETNTTYESFED